MAFGTFCMSKKQKVLGYNQFKKYFIDNTRKYLWKKSWNDGKCIFHKRGKKNILLKKVVVCTGVSTGLLQTHQNFFSTKCFFLFFFTLMKNTFAIISWFFFTKSCWYHLVMCFLTIIHFKLSVKKDFFLM